MTRIPISPHFYLDEFLPVGWTGSVPAEVKSNILVLVDEVLEPARVAMACPLRVTSGWRPPARNAQAGGVSGSDHLSGRAADVQALGDSDEMWDAATLRLFHWIRENAEGRYGQLILEDHRATRGAGKLWVHVATPSIKHAGKPGDANRLLVSFAKGSYQPWASDLA